MGIAVVGLVAASVPALEMDGAQADAATSAVGFYTPRDGETVSGTIDVMLGATADVQSVRLEYRSSRGSGTKIIDRTTGSDVFETSLSSLSGTVGLTVTGYAASEAAGDPVSGPVAESVTVSSSATSFDFVRPHVEGGKVRPLGVFQRADGHSFARASGTTTSTAEPHADAPTVSAATPGAATLPAPAGVAMDQNDDRTSWTFREPVDLTGNPGLPTPGAQGRAVIRVTDGTSSDAIEAPLYNQKVVALSSGTAHLPSGPAALTTSATDQYGQAVVGVPVRLTGYASGSRSAVASSAIVTDAAGKATFTGYPAGYYIAYADLNLDGRRGPKEPCFKWEVGTVAHGAPGHLLFHSDKRLPRAGGVLNDSLRGTRQAAARHYQWIDQDGQLSYTSRAVLRGGAGRVTQPAHLTWVNAHGAPFNPRWLGRGRFENRAWAGLRRRPGLRNAEMTFQQDAAHHLSVEWEVKNIKPFTTSAALNAAFANLAAAAQRYYGASWRSRVEVKMLSNLSGGQAFALRVLQVAHAHGFTTIYLARGAATRKQIPASAHQYVTYVRGAAAGVYAPLTAPASQYRPAKYTEPSWDAR